MTVKQFSQAQAKTQRPPYRTFHYLASRARRDGVRGTYGDWQDYFGQTRHFPSKADFPADLLRADRIPADRGAPPPDLHYGPAKWPGN